MKNLQHFNLKQLETWLTTEVVIRLQRKWIVAAAAAALGLVPVALD